MTVSFTYEMRNQLTHRVFRSYTAIYARHALRRAAASRYFPRLILLCSGALLIRRHRCTISFSLIFTQSIASFVRKKRIVIILTAPAALILVLFRGRTYDGRHAAILLGPPPHREASPPMRRGLPTHWPPPCQRSTDIHHTRRRC